MADLLVRFRAYITDVIGGRLEKMRKAIEMRIGNRFENL